MPRHAAPNHKDCWIDCPDGGFAIFVPPHGPCEKGCDDPSNALARVLRKGVDTKFAFKIQVTGLDHFLNLCQRVANLDVHQNDRAILLDVINRILFAKPPYLDTFVSEHAAGTVSNLVRDIAKAVPGNRGGGNDPGPTGGKRPEDDGKNFPFLPGHSRDHGGGQPGVWY